MKLCIAILMVLGLVSCASTTDTKTTETDNNKSANSKSASTEETKKASGAEAERALASMMECRLGGDVRTMGVRKTASGGCETVYTKNGNETIPATAANGTAHCEGITNNIASNLKEAGFECK